MAAAPIIEKISGFGQSTTSGAGPALVAYTTTSNRSYQVWCKVSAVSTGNTEGAGYILAATFRNLGSLIQVGSGATVILSNEDDAVYSATIDNNGADIEVQTTGVTSTTIDWACSCRILVSVG